MPLTELILTENIPGLGAEADVVKVRRGYARNYLLPHGKAHEVTPGALRQIDALKQKRAEREAREQNEAEELGRRIGKARFVFTLETGETGKAFGSVTAQDIMNRIKNELGAEIDRHKIVLERPIKDTGEHDVTIKLHHDVTAQLVFHVKSAEEPRDRGAEAEKGVLGSMLLSPRQAIAECVEKINEQYFYVPAHQTIYTALVDLWNAGQAIDLITFTQVLRDRNLLDSVGGAAFVTSLFTFVPTAANLEYYLEIVRDKYILRQIISAATESVRRAYEEQDEVNNLLDEVEQRIFAVGDDRFKGQMLSMKDQVMEAIEAIEKLYERKGGITGI